MTSTLSQARGVCALSALLASLVATSVLAVDTRVPLRDPPPVPASPRVAIRAEEPAPLKQVPAVEVESKDAATSATPAPIVNLNDVSGKTDVIEAEQKSEEDAKNEQKDEAGDASKENADASELTEEKPKSSDAEQITEDTDKDEEAEKTSIADQPLTPELLEMRHDIRRTLLHYYNRAESTAGRSPWGLMHTLIAYGVDTEIIANGKKVNAIGWLAWNGSGRGLSLFYLSRGQIQTRIGPGVQGHAGQFLAMLAQSRVKKTFPMRIGGQDFTVEDLIKHEMKTCRPRSELTFKLIALAHYLPSDTQWKDQQGRTWNIERLIKEELAQPINGAACGGSHRLMGFSYAVRTREKRGEPMTGEWLRAKKYIDKYHEYTMKLQNPNGSFSSNWFRGRGMTRDIGRSMQTSGHMLEWLLYSLPEERLRDPDVIKSVKYLTNLMWQNRNYRWEIGPRGHALHALALYDQRVFGAKPGNGPPKVDTVIAQKSKEVSLD